MRAERGEYGYLKQRKRGALLHTLLMAGAGAAIFVVGLLLNKMEASNIFTIAAVLMVLPAAKSLVAVIVLFPYKETAKADKERLDAYAKAGDTVLYDVVFTSAEKVMHLTQVYVTDHQLIGISLRKKDNIEISAKYLKKELEQRAIPYAVFLTKEEGVLAKRMALRGQEPMDSGGREGEAKKEVLAMLRTFTM